MHEIVASVQVKLLIPGNIKITVGNIATAIYSLGVEKKLAEEVIHAVDKKKLEEYCGTENARGNGEKRYRRAGTRERHPVTRVGRRVCQGGCSREWV